MKPFEKPGAGNPGVRFDERARETGQCQQAQAAAPFLDSTGIEVYFQNTQIQHLVASAIDKYILFKYVT